VGAATDIYALGCVLYEMLVGEPPYVGSTPQAILGKIIQAKPVSATEARRTVPANVDAVVRRALEKVPADRFPSATALARALADPAFRHGAVDGAGIVHAGRWKVATLVAASLAAALGVALVAALQTEDPAPLRVARFEAPFREGQGPTSLIPNAYGLSPDGSMLIFNRGEASGQLWMRRWDDLEAIPIRGTARGGQAVMSPGGELLAFVQQPEIRVLSLAGGVTRTVGPGYWPRWAPNGDLYYGVEVTDGAPAIMRAPSGGGAPEVVRADPGELEFQLIWDFLPDGGRALMVSFAEGDSVGQLGVIHVETGEVTPLGVAGDWPIFYTPSGHLLYWADSTAMAAPFDPASLEVGAPVRILENVMHFDLSRDGTLAYSTFGGAVIGRTNLVLVTPEGGKEVLSELEGITWFPRFSPDGARLAYGLSESFNPNIRGDLWVMDVARGARTRVTFEANNRWYPIWTRDGTRLTHADDVGNENRVLSTMADGSGGVDTIFEVGPRRFPTAWSPDGRTLAYYQGGQGAVPTRDIWMLRVDGPEPVESPLIQTEFGELGAIFSPDGRWVVYVSDKSGQLDVYARPFPGPGPEVTVSVGGGIEPVWGADGNEIYYRRPGELMVAPVQRSGSTLSVGAARQVMPDTYLRATSGGAGGMANYDVAPDGSGFVMIEDVSGAETVEPERLYVVFNWLEELKRLVPTN
jgi:serine/threonine-protein kinase